jgi:adenine-specific DNA-methyltransferase
MVIQNKPSEIENYIYRVGDLTYITPYYIELRELSVTSQTLYELGFQVKTGTVVWNKYKKDLDDDEGALLVYSSNINKENELVLGNLGGQKKQYIQNCNKPTESGPALLIARGYGNSYQFRYTVVDIEEYYVENHLNVVYRVNGDVDIRDIAESLSKQETKDFIRYFTGNGALSKTELERVFPVWL